ncbi:MAG: translation initiation factor IF-3 [Thermoleophilia bacterium]
MPPRRGPDTRPPAGPSTRINDAIRAESVRLIDADGENRGVVPLARAQEIAANAGLDLVEVAADARPPVCRIMDYGKWRYEQEQKAKQARRHQSTITIKEIKFRPKIDPHDYATKKGHVERFLRHRDKVKITIMFRGRELMHPERGEAILLKLAEELKDLAIVESRPNLDGRNMVMMLAPVKNPPPPGSTEEGVAAEPSAGAPAEAPAEVADEVTAEAEATTS